MNLFNKKKKNEKGFTLVELLVVIAIIGILAAVIAPNIFAQIEKGKTSALISEYRAAKTAALLYQVDNPTATSLALANLNSYLEKSLTTSGIAPFGGSYTLVNDFLIVPSVPLKAGESIATTLFGSNSITSNIALSAATSAHNIVWVDDAAGAILANAPITGETGFLAIRIKE